jgi:hypothetical protein
MTLRQITKHNEKFLSILAEHFDKPPKDCFKLHNQLFAFYNPDHKHDEEIRDWFASIEARIAAIEAARGLTRQ